jgi:hypothetical protein
VENSSEMQAFMTTVKFLDETKTSRARDVRDLSVEASSALHECIT